MAAGDEERPVAGGPPGLTVRELDAAAAFARERDRYRQAVSDLFDALRGDSRFDATLDRRVTEDLIELAPPGLDELFAVLAVIDALLADPAATSSADGRPDLVVLDTAPTGHTLRLLALPSAARQWVKALLAVLLKYRGAMGLGKLSQDLVALSRSLRELEALLVDPARTRFLAVARPSELARRETERLVDALKARGVTVPALVINAATSPGCRRCRARAEEEARIARDLERRSGCAILLAPAAFPPPRGLDALRSWARGWTHAWAPATPISIASSKGAARLR
jgi:arsenite-transporting ATPase